MKTDTLSNAGLLWHVIPSEGETIQCSNHQLKSLIGTGVISKGTPVWHEGMADWKACGEVHPNFFKANLKRLRTIKTPDSQEEQGNAHRLLIGIALISLFLLVFWAIYHELTKSPMTSSSESVKGLLLGLMPVAVFLAALGILTRVGTGEAPIGDLIEFVGKLFVPMTVLLAILFGLISSMSQPSFSGGMGVPASSAPLHLLIITLSVTVIAMNLMLRQYFQEAVGYSSLASFILTPVTWLSCCYISFWAMNAI